MMYRRQFVPGIDISYWNTYDLDQLGADQMIAEAAARGVEWVMIRAGKGGQSDNGLTSTGQDRTLGTMKAAVEANGLVGFPYWRVYNILEEDPMDQADRAFDAFSAATITQSAPWVIDVEEFWDDAVGIAPMGRELVGHWLAVFRNTLAMRGATNVAVYTRRTWWDPFVPNQWGDRPLLTAHWLREEVPEDARAWEHWAWQRMPGGPAIPAVWGSADVWQFAAISGRYGEKIGASSVDIDCNLMTNEFWSRISGQI